MAVTTVVKTIGSTGVFSTPQLWEDGAPANLTTAERSAATTFLVAAFTQGEALTFVGSGATGKFLDTDSTGPGTGTYVTYGIITGNPAASDVVTGGTSGATCVLTSGTANFVGIIWEGQCQNQEFTGSGTIVTIAGSTTSASAYKHLTTAPGASFRDNANVQTNALRYNAANGCGLTETSSSQPVVIATEANNHVSKLQLNGTNADDGRALEGSGATGAFFDDLILEGEYTGSSTTSGVLHGGGNFTMRNSVIILRGAAADHIVGTGTSSPNFYNCTIVCVDNVTAPTSIFLSGASGTVTVQNCGLFAGDSTKAIKAGSATFNFTTCYSDISGTSGVTQATYSSEFQNVNEATQDFRLKSGAAQIDAGTTDTTNAAIDIAGTARPQGSAYDVGCWEFVSAVTTTSITPAAAALTAAGVAAVRVVILLIAPAVAILSIAGVAPTAPRTTVMTPAVAVITITGVAPTAPTNTLLTPAAGALTITGETPTAQTTTFYTPAAGELLVVGESPTAPVIMIRAPPAADMSISGVAPTLVLTTVLTPASGAITIAGQDPTAPTNTLLTPTAGAITIAGQDPSAPQVTVLTPAAGSLSLSGETPVVRQETFIAPAAGSLSIVGVAPTAPTNTLLTPDAGSLSLVGNAPTVMQGEIITPAAGTLSLSGNAPVVAQTTLLTPDAGSLSLVGREPAVAQTALLTPAAGSMVFSGETPSAVREVVITPDAGALSLVGREPVVSGNVSITPAAGDLTLSGQQAAVTIEVSIAPGAGSLSLAGQQAAVTIEVLVTPSAGELSLSGQQAATGIGVSIAPGAGQLSLAGQQPGVLADVFITPAAGSLVVTGALPGVLINPVRTITLLMDDAAPGVTLSVVGGVGIQLIMETGDRNPMQALTSFDENDVGILLTLTLTFVNFNPAGATAVLIARPPGGPDQPPRDMVLTGNVATYLTVAGDFEAGYYISEVRVTKGGVSVGSEHFLIVVDP